MEKQIETNNKVKSRTTQEIDTFGRLGRELKISPKTNLTVNKEGFKSEYFVKTIEITIGIGKDHTASLVMDIDAWKAFKNGEVVNVTTNKEFKQKFL